MAYKNTRKAKIAVKSATFRHDVQSIAREASAARRDIRVMNSFLSRRVATVLFSLIMACLLGLGGLLVGTYLWGHFGPPSTDPDDMDAYLFGLLVGGLLGMVGFVGSLWKFWSHAAKTSRRKQVRLVNDITVKVDLAQGLYRFGDIGSYHSMKRYRAYAHYLPGVDASPIMASSIGPRSRSATVPTEGIPWRPQLGGSES